MPSQVLLLAALLAALLLAVLPVWPAQAAPGAQLAGWRAETLIINPSTPPLAPAPQPLGPPVAPFGAQVTLSGKGCPPSKIRFDSAGVGRGFVTCYPATGPDGLSVAKGSAAARLGSVNGKLVLAITHLGSDWANGSWDVVRRQ